MTDFRQNAQGLNKAVRALLGIIREVLFLFAPAADFCQTVTKTEDKIMKNDYKPIKPMKEIPDQLRKLRRQFLRYQQAEIVYSLYQL